MQHRSGMDKWIDDVRALVKTKPPYNSAFVSLAIHSLLTSITLLEGMKAMVETQKAEIEKLKSQVEETKDTKTNRNQEIIDEFKAGSSKEQIAKKHGITRQRVHFLLKKHGSLAS